VVGGAIFVVAGSPTEQQGPVASLLSTAGWAGAGARVVGQSWVVTPAGVMTPAEARRRGSDPGLHSPDGTPLRRVAPALVKTAVKDLRQWRRQDRFRIDPRGPWTDTDVAFVWQRHELFQRAGLRLAQDLGVPSVLFVPATVVWEAEQWGTRRPGWGRWLEAHGEAPALRSADVVACGTPEVAEQARRLGATDERLLITSSGVDLELFEEPSDPEPLRAQLGIAGRFVVGWVGSFRRFHALEQAVEAVADLDGATLLLVGDGPERSRIERLARDRRVPVVCSGTVPQSDLPAYLRAMDAALVLAPEGGPFHYSPLKLAEYLAAAVPVVAPAVGQLTGRLTDGVDALLVPPHDAGALAVALRRLQDDPGERARIGRAGRQLASEAWSWDHQVRRVLDALPR
jgi:glycosyltransferase involved in cell wall biosynthesis